MSFTIVAANLPPRLRGKLRGRMLEVDAGVFVSDGNAGERVSAWEAVLLDLPEDARATVIFTNARGETDFLSVGPKRREIVAMEGGLAVEVRPRRRETKT